MAITLSSDLIMDVVRSADPVRRSAAAAKLGSISGYVGKPNVFEAVVADEESRSERISNSSLSLTFEDGGNGGREAVEHYRDFETFVLRNLFEALLPKSESGAFGTGPSADVWRSMAADELAKVYTEAGGTGIAGMVSGRDGNAPLPDAQWPYFSLPSISSFTG